MNTLVLGGTQFVGRAIVEELLARGHEVTLFHRGKTNPDLFPQCAHVLGDRTADIGLVKGTHWDAVIDVSGYLPSQLVASVGIETNFYTFISTISIYDTDGVAGPHTESSPQFAEGAMDAEAVTGENYGPLKVTCERLVREAFPTSHAMIRPGIIIGPNDHTGRFPYWIARLDQYDEVMVPDSFEVSFQGIDTRDLAAFVVRQTENRAVGAWNAVGERTTFGVVIDEIRRQSGREHRLVVASAEELEAVGVQLWVDLPITVAAGTAIFDFDPSCAVSAGLRLRPLSETIADTMGWIRETGGDGLGKYGMTRERELEAISKLSGQS